MQAYIAHPKPAVAQPRPVPQKSFSTALTQINEPRGCRLSQLLEACTLLRLDAATADSLAAVLDTTADYGAPERYPTQVKKQAKSSKLQAG
jgi:hypothetical protein